MEEYTEVIEETEEETDQEKSFGREIAEAAAIGIVSGVGTLAGFYVFGWVVDKVNAIRARSASRKVVFVEAEMPETDPINPEE